MKLEVGMYVRTEYGIAKIVDIDKHTCSIYVDKNLELLIDGTRVAYEFIIGEPSFYLIDLVQVGDYVNGLKVYEVRNDIKGFGVVVFSDCSIHEWQISSIVTKEQFESMSYKVGV